VSWTNDFLSHNKDMKPNKESEMLANDNKNTTSSRTKEWDNEALSKSNE
jgi:hypothetical protein